MVYIFHYRNLNCLENDTYQVFTSLMAIHKHIGINYDTLNYQFNRNNRTTYSKDNFTITKVQPITNTRK